MLGQGRADGIVIGIGSVYGNIAMLGIPLTLSALGNQAAGPMALILAVNTPLLWLVGTLQMAWTERKLSKSITSLVLPILSDLGRNPILLAIGCGFLWRVTGLGLHPVIDRTVELLAQAGSPTALIALGINLFRFEIKGQTLGIAVMCPLKLLAMPAFAWVLAFHLLDLPPVAAGVVVLFAAMPAGANAYIFAAQYGRLVNAVSGTVAIGTILALATLPAIVSLLTVAPR
jgi:predicted permease